MSENWKSWDANNPPVEGAFLTERGWEIPLKGSNSDDERTELIVACKALAGQAGTSELVSVGIENLNILNDNTNLVTDDVLEIETVFNEKVYVDTTSGTPTIPVYANDGTTLIGDATYASGSSKNKLKFTYTILEDDLEDTNINVGADITLNGGTIKDSDDNDVTVSFDQLGFNVTINQ